uniref:SFRICE_010911 n=1 Tax=Spodoptera frugiperda TaxID=7108 RepID=A0A2H1WBN4_SPOFR
MGNILFSIIWLIILIIVAFWIAGFAAGLYIIILPFTVCIEALSGLTDFLLSVVQFPRFCAQRMMEGRGFN